MIHHTLDQPETDDVISQGENDHLECLNEAEGPAMDTGTGIGQEPGPPNRAELPVEVPIAASPVSVPIQGIPTATTPAKRLEQGTQNSDIVEAPSEEPSTNASAKQRNQEGYGNAERCGRPTYGPCE